MELFMINGYAELYMRFGKLQKQLARLQAELDNVRSLIRQKGDL